jgi:hypothetical protein
MKQEPKKCPFCTVPCPFDHCAWKQDDKNDKKPEDKPKDKSKK